MNTWEDASKLVYNLKKLWKNNIFSTIVVNNGETEKLSELIQDNFQALLEDEGILYDSEKVDELYRKYINTTGDDRRYDNIVLKREELTNQYEEADWVGVFVEISSKTLTIVKDEKGSPECLSEVEKCEKEGKKYFYYCPYVVPEVITNEWVMQYAEYGIPMLYNYTLKERESNGYKDFIKMIKGEADGVKDIDIYTFFSTSSILATSMPMSKLVKFLSGIEGISEEEVDALVTSLHLFSCRLVLAWHNMDIVGMLLCRDVDKKKTRVETILVDKAYDCNAISKELLEKACKDAGGIEVFVIGAVGEEVKKLCDGIGCIKEEGSDVMRLKNPYCYY